MFIVMTKDGTVKVTSGSDRHASAHGAPGVTGQQAAGEPGCSRAHRDLDEVYSAGQGEAIMRKGLWDFRK